MDFYHSDHRRGSNCDVSNSWNIEGCSGGGDHDRVYLEAQATKSKRTYDCTFCKRGFTNAQALGGHMNIHRRDRAKAVKPIVVSSDHEYGSPPAAALTGTGRYNNYPVTMDYHQPSRSSSTAYNYNHQYLCFQQRHVAAAAGPRRSATVVPADGDLWGANLSLGIGSGGRNKQEDHRELDLELRLGHMEP